MDAYARVLAEGYSALDTENGKVRFVVDSVLMRLADDHLEAYARYGPERYTDIKQGWRHVDHETVNGITLQQRARKYHEYRKKQGRPTTWLRILVGPHEDESKASELFARWSRENSDLQMAFRKADYSDFDRMNVAQRIGFSAKRDMKGKLYYLLILD